MIKLCAFADEAGESLLSQIDALKSNNIGYIEIRNVDGKNVLDFSDDDVACYKRQLDEKGIKVWSIGSPLGKVDINENFEKHLEKVERIFEIAKMFSAKRIRGFSFFNAYQNKEEVLKRLNVIGNLATQNGLLFCHENEKEIYGDSIDRVLEIAKSVPSIKLVYDPANYLQCRENASEALKKTIDYTEYFHIKDVISKTEQLVPSGYGDGDIDGLIKAVRGKDVVLTVEPHLKIFSGYGNIDNTQMKNKFEFNSNRQAFDFAVTSLKNIILKNDYVEINGAFKEKK